MSPSPRYGLPSRVEAVLARHAGEHAGAVTAGAVVRIDCRGETVARAAAGWAQRHDCGEPTHRPVEPTTRFDVASLTKIVATTALALRLVDAGQLTLATRVGELLPAFAGADKDAVTLAHLATHTSGLEPWQPVYLHAGDRAAALEWVARQPLASEPATQHAYSDLGFMLLGGALERHTGQRLDRLAAGGVFDPLGMTRTGYRPRDETAGRDGTTGGPAGATFAATSCGDAHEQRMIATGEPYPVDGDPADFDGWRAHTLVGEPQDGNAAHAFGGVAGHAGLFADVDDLARFGGAMLAGAQGRANPLAAPPVVQTFLRPTGWPRQRVGWWGDPAGVATGERLLGHSGFTGARLAIAPADELVVVLLANRHQLGPPPPDVTPLWRDLVAVALEAAG